MEQGISVLLEALRPGSAALWLLVTAVISYLLGTLNGAILVSKFFLKDDVRKHGSGNGGLTNFQRTYRGSKLILIVLVTDMLKMVLAVAISWGLFSVALAGAPVPLFVKYWAGVFCVLGHVFPCTLHFQGGKGILAGGTLALLVDWRVALFAWGFFLLGVVFTRWVSLGSVMAATAFGVSSSILFPIPSIMIPALLAAALIDWKHRGNLKRLIRGEEPKLSFRSKKKE
ncbi:MAG: glycerol-3-phosphate acyltransferase [Evtepia sp.]|uniref:glycerol-3-phosphate acyltransferase n=1 Tax=Evtepia sp. TaxID=2773933 RepID=UPI002A76362A|nr:glycerol-3-phosphate acyltransferase [Evtepia sp.]MDY3014788.1 glycerol-3-phosphate acyltransferase [Evtepia sp.]